LAAEIKFKPLYLFFLASNSLLFAGSSVTHTWNIPQLLIIQWCGICGIFLIYRFNDFIDQTHDFSFSIRRFLNTKLHVFVLGQLFFITLPLAIYFLSDFRLIMLICICMLGILYSLNFPLNGKNYRIKNIFLVKNIVIGFAWGSLILVGAGLFQDKFVIGLFIFTSIQVIIGSVLRDIPDIEKDKTDQVSSLPVVFGTSTSLFVLHALNLFSFLIGFLLKSDAAFLIFMLIILTWRAITFIKIQKNNTSKLWSQTLNLLTCFFIFIIILVQYLFDFY
jgi:4-hydroxybenzoate polyprenyltransferase